MVRNVTSGLILVFIFQQKLQQNLGLSKGMVKQSETETADCDYRLSADVKRKNKDAVRSSTRNPGWSLNFRTTVNLLIKSFYRTRCVICYSIN